ncbi:MAG: chemotaxis protein CheW [Bacteroidales bacterium]|nr:chemotaxis protein CheW [Bacteroidales bacterium]
MRERGTDFLIFLIEHHRFAIPVKDVEKVIRAVTITQVPESGDLLHGVFNYHGILLPVINLRRKFSFDPKEISPEQRLLIVNTHLRQIAILVDEVEEVTSVSEKELFQAKAAENSSNDDEAGSTLLFSDKNGIIILYELERLLSGELDKEINRLRELLSKKESTGE